MRRIYLDYAAATPAAPEVLAAMKPYFSVKFGNPGSLHSFGQEAMGAVDGAREKIARAVNADFRSVVFTGSATEANNLALRGAVRQFVRLRADAPQNRLSRRSGGGEQSALSAENPRRRDQAFPPARASSGHAALGGNFSPKVIISSVEHESILETARDLGNDGVEVVALPVDKNGRVDLKKLENEINERTALISVMYVNNEIGSVQPIDKIADIIDRFKYQGAKPSFPAKAKTWASPRRQPERESLASDPRYPLFHTDASQAPAYFDCDVKKLGVDLMTLSSQKVYGPKGVGALYVRNAKTLSPLLTGGGQEFGLRSGTENVPGIVGFGTAMAEFNAGFKKNFSKTEALKKYFWRGLKKIVPDAEVNGAADAPHILNVYFPSEYAGDLLVKLDMAGIAASSGSACSARAFTPSHVLAALGLPAERIRGSVRFSFGMPTTKGEIDEVMRRIKKVIGN